MTENEAIRILGDTTLCTPLGQAAFVAIESMKKLQQYRAIGTVEECQEARERIEVMSNTENREETCFIPEKDNPYPLCVGRGEEKCKDCQIRADWEPEDPFGVE